MNETASKTHSAFIPMNMDDKNDISVPDSIKDTNEVDGGDGNNRTKMHFELVDGEVKLIDGVDYDRDTIVNSLRKAIEEAKLPSSDQQKLLMKVCKAFSLPTSLITSDIDDTAQAVAQVVARQKQLLDSTSNVNNGDITSYTIKERDNSGDFKEKAGALKPEPDQIVDSLDFSGDPKGQGDDEEEE